MEYPASWSLDSEESDFEKMEQDVNASAIDFAKFGLLFLSRFRQDKDENDETAKRNNQGHQRGSGTDAELFGPCRRQPEARDPVSGTGCQAGSTAHRSA
jgi:hypothetical protein